MSMNAYVCPHCKSDLTEINSVLKCQECKETYSYKDEIPVLRNINKSSIWQYDKDEIAEKVIKKTKKNGWKKAIEDEYEDINSSWISSQSRAEGIYLSGIDKNSVVLDAGCGWGALSCTITPIAKEIYGVDSNNYGLEFAKLRCEQDNITNAYFSNSDIGKLPFKDDFFDLVILNGVLEWTPLAYPELTPDNAQRVILKELHRVLKKGGQIFIAIENRYGFRYLLGKPDEHTSIRFITILPRFIAGLYYKLIKKSEYRAYTHSVSEIKQLLKNSGFINTDFYATLPDYRFYKYIIPLEKNNESYRLLLTMLKHKSVNSKKYKMYYMLFRTFSGCGIQFLRYFTNAFIALGEK